MMRPDVIVIGGGVVGLTTAWWLLEAGYRVRVLERAAEPASGASHANGGQLSYRYVSPLADAGVPLKALHWLLQRDGPLRLRPEADPRQWRWLAQFLRRCNGASNARTTAVLLQLGAHSRAGMEQLMQRIAPADFAWREPGKLVLYRSPSLFDKAAARADDAALILSPAEAAAREPALATLRPALAGAIFTAGEAVADCRAFCLALAGLLHRHPRYDGTLQGSAHGWRSAGARVAAVETSLGPLQADQFVLAAGIQSRDLAARAGLRLPLYPLKGYSLSAPVRPGDDAPSISVTDFERKTLYARIGDQLRIAAMVDMVGERPAIDPRRVASLLRTARAAMPHAADYAHAIAWSGLRPATPDGAPIIGATPVPNLWLNVGHGALGFTFSCGSASLLAGMMAGQPAPFALEGLGLR
ncbi:MAG TPA: D-amino acid dehydrogenase [Burkholderiaceae bacterium]|nr:D-amino acid dehydrogenase [Burkholderiaceae bacterium]